MATNVPPSGKSAWSGPIPSPGQVIGYQEEGKQEVDLRQLTMAERAKVLQGVPLKNEEHAKRAMDDAQTQAETQSQAAQAQGYGGPPPLDVRDIRDLDDERQKFVLDAIRETQEAVTNPRPSLNLVDPTPAPPPTPEPEIQYTETEIPAAEPVAAPSPEYVEAPRPEPKPEPQAHAHPAGNPSPGPEPLLICKWCGGDPKANPPEPTENDFLQYIAHLSGGRFEKEYNMYKGHLSVTFHNLTPSEDTAIFRQILHERENGLDQGLIPQKFTEYRTLASISSYKLQGQVPVKFRKLADLLADHPADSKDPTPLPGMMKYAEKTLFSSRPVLGKIATYYHQRFLPLIAAIESKTLEEDGFFNPVVGG